MMIADDYAVVDAVGNVINVVLWDGKTNWNPPEGATAIKINGSGAGIGWTYKDGGFIRPTIPAIPEEDRVTQAEQKKYNLLLEATQKISILQDAFDLEMATEDEKIHLTSLKKYRVLLNRIDTSKPENIEWPKAPE